MLRVCCLCVGVLLERLSVVYARVGGSSLDHGGRECERVSEYRWPRNDICSAWSTARGGQPVIPH